MTQHRISELADLLESQVALLCQEGLKKAAQQAREEARSLRLLAAIGA